MNTENKNEFNEKCEITEKCEIKEECEIKAKVNRKLLVSYYYILDTLLNIKLSEFSEKDRQIKRDIDLLLSLRKYFNIGKSNETFESFSAEIKDNLRVI